MFVSTFSQPKGWKCTYSSSELRNQSLKLSKHLGSKLCKIKAQKILPFLCKKSHSQRDVLRSGKLGFSCRPGKGLSPTSKALGLIAAEIFDKVKRTCWHSS
jgi:hypothetical protein